MHNAGRSELGLDSLVIYVKNQQRTDSSQRKLEVGSQGRISHANVQNQLRPRRGCTSQDGYSDLNSIPSKPKWCHLPAL